MRIVAIIPARGGSKGIPKKNLARVGGKPLIAWTIEAAQKSRFIDRVVVSSDSDEILSVAERYGASGLKRPAGIATDGAPPEKVILHAIGECRRQKYYPDFIVYLQPTSPPRTARHIDRAFELLMAKKARSLISVSEADKKILKAFLLSKKGRLEAVSDGSFPFMNRQKLPAVYAPNGAIYIYRTDDFLKRGKFFAKNTLPFVMAPEESVDLDVPEDIALVERLLARRKKR